MQETNEKTLLQMIDGGGLDQAMTVRQRDVQRLGQCQEVQSTGDIKKVSGLTAMFLSQTNE